MCTLVAFDDMFTLAAMMAVRVAVIAFGVWTRAVDHHKCSMYMLLRSEILVLVKWTVQWTAIRQRDTRTRPQRQHATIRQVPRNSTVARVREALKSNRRMKSVPVK